MRWKWIFRQRRSNNVFIIIDTDIGDSISTGLRVNQYFYHNMLFSHGGRWKSFDFTQTSEVANYVLQMFGCRVRRHNLLCFSIATRQTMSLQCLSMAINHVRSTIHTVCCQSIRQSASQENLAANESWLATGVSGRSSRAPLVPPASTTVVYIVQTRPEVF